MPRAKYHADTAVDPKDQRVEAFAVRLNNLLLARGWNQADLTREVQKHVPPGVEFKRHLPSSWLRGKHMPSPQNLDLIAKALKVQVADLVPTSVTANMTVQDRAAQFTMSSSGCARIKLDMELPADVALKIIQMANDAKRKKEEA